MHKIEQWAKEVQEKIIHKLRGTALEIGSRCPHAEHGGIYDNQPISWWTNGFWPGILWTAYRATREPLFLNVARECEKQLDQVLREYVHTDHDAGFMWSLAAVADYKITGNPKAKTRGLVAANYLAGRFHLTGNYIQAWNGKSGWAIIDCMMNLPLLYWASEMVNDGRYRAMAQAHTRTVLEHFCRPDGSVNHIVAFDPETGEVDNIPQGQGAAPDSKWARGTSWAVYGFALGYGYTKNQEYLEQAKKTADFFLEQLPEDHVCYWDFAVPVTPETPRDTSAAACAASGMIEIFRHSGEQKYLDGAVAILQGLTEHFADFTLSCQQLLNGGTGNFPQGDNINVGLIYGDYFYFEAVNKLCGEKGLFW